MAIIASTTKTPAVPGTPLLRRPPRVMRNGLWYALAALGLALVIVIGEIVLHVRSSAPRNQMSQVERELRLNTLHPGERVLRTVEVFRRTGADYFRRTRGLLVLTDHRLIYLGAPPRDITGAADAPPAFVQRDFPIDTLVRVTTSFTMLGLAHALTVEDPASPLPDDDVKLGVPSADWPRAKMMIAAWTARQKKLRGIGVWEQKVRAARRDVEKILADYRAQPVYHVVRAGDAVGSIADWYQTTPDSIRALNHLNGNVIKVGQRLLIRPGH